MKIITTLFFFLSLFMIGCKPDVLPPSEPPAKLTGVYKVTNVENDIHTTFKEILDVKRSKHWSLKEDGAYLLRQDIELTVLLENQDTIPLWIGMFSKENDSSLLILEGEELNYPNRNWDYKSTDVEIENFYSNAFFNNVVMSNHYYSNYGHQEDFKFEVIKVQKAVVNNEEKSYITIHFGGTFSGPYDQDGMFNGLATVANGIFKGIIEK